MARYDGYLESQIQHQLVSQKLPQAEIHTARQDWRVSMAYGPDGLLVFTLVNDSQPKAQPQQFQGIVALVAYLSNVAPPAPTLEGPQQPQRGRVASVLHAMDQFQQDQQPEAPQQDQALIIRANLGVQSLLATRYLDWQDQGAPETVGEWARPFNRRVTVRDGALVCQSWRVYRISIRGVSGSGDELKWDWTSKLLKRGGLGQLRGEPGQENRLDYKLAQTAYQAWLEAGQPPRFVYLEG